MKRKKARPLFLLAAAVFLALVIWTVWGNKALELNTYTIFCDKLPDSFHGYRIAQVSDLHNAEFGQNNQKLLALLREAGPDIIVITGDMVDSYHTDIDIALGFAREAVKIAPCYYVTGNHEARISQYATLKTGLEDAGVVILENQRVELERGEETVALIGVDDPSFRTSYLFGNSPGVMSAALGELVEAQDVYTILLSHRPELFETYVQSGVDLVFSGHAHGGQFRLPFVGGLVAPNQGLFPEYDSGLYAQSGTNMLVSRGLGNSIIPIRFNNRPEVIVVELLAQSLSS